jgi:DNA replication protein DnaC
MSLTDEELANTDLSRHCEKHGDYQAKTVSLITGRNMVLDYCMICSKEKNDAEEALKVEEQTARDERFRKQHLINCGISPRYLDVSLSTIKPTAEQAKVYKSITEYLEARSVSSLIIAGMVGTGKTLLAQALAQDLLKAKRKFVFSTARQIIRDIRSTWKRDSDRSEDEVIAMYVNTDYLFIDEVGIQYGTESEQIAMFDIINGRYEYERPTILITNLDIIGLKEIMGERIIDRLRQDGGELLAFNWKSLRT